MEVIAVKKIQTHFFEILEEVRNGKRVGVLYDGIKIPVAMIVPYAHVKARKTKRKIGILEGKASFKEIENGKITVEEFLGL